ncbi:MAG: bile acid:sodium symporter family protein [Campylobacteraceae bacterium]
MTKKILSLFPLWAILLAVIAFYLPSFFVGYKTSITPLLTLIMFLMGTSLSISDFTRVVKRPLLIVLGMGMQFIFMPLFAFLISKFLNLSTDLMVGMLLVGAVSGGTASNVMTFLAKGDVALSITLTACSTLMSVFLTPLLVWFYVGAEVPVDVNAMLLGILQIVVIPVVVGLICAHFLKKEIERFGDFFALFSMLAIIFIIAIVVALNKANIASVGIIVFIGVILHNSLGLVSGFCISKLLGYDHKTCKTMSIEIGMQNSGLAVALATNYFKDLALAALPGAIFSVWHNISGSILAGYWGKRADVQDKK